MKLEKTSIVFLVILIFQFNKLAAQENWALRWEEKGPYVISDARFSLDNKKILMKNNNAELRLLDAQNGTLIWSNNSKLGARASPIFSPDESTVAYGDIYGITILDANNGNVLKSFAHYSFVTCYKFSPNGEEIIGSDLDKNIKKWDIGTGKIIWSVNLNSLTNSIAFNPGGSRILTANSDSTVKLWDSSNGEILWEKKVPGSPIALFHQDGANILCYSDKTVQLLNTSDGSVIWSKDYANVSNLHFSPDGSKITFIEVHYMRSLNTSDGSEKWISAGDVSYLMTYSQNGDRIVTSDHNYAVKVWNAENGTLLWTGYHSNVVSTLNFSPDCKNIVSGGLDNTLKIWTNEKLITLLEPNGNERYKYTSTQAIKWSSINVRNIKIEYSTDNGTNWFTIVSRTPASTGSYNWTIPKTPSTECWIKISDSDQAEINDINDLSFVIFQPITITSPNGFEVWKGGTNQNITWISESVSSVSISYSSDNGNSWNSIVNNIDANIGHYSWIVPLLTSSQCKIKIIDSNNPSINDDNDEQFAIYRDLELTSPNGGEFWEVGSVQSISWSSNTTYNIKIELSTNNGANWTTIIQSISANSGNYFFVVPNSPYQQCKIRISDVSNTNIKDESDYVFTIYNKVLTLISPNGGENLISGKTFTTTWISKHVNNIKIEYTTDNGSNWSTLVNSTPANDKNYSFKVPKVTSTNCKIRITDIEKPELQDVSDSAFKIYQPIIAITSPRGGESWIAGTTQKITWLSSNVENVKIEYTTNSGTTWQSITTSTNASTWSYDHVVPSISSTQCKIRISDTNDVEVQDESPEVFTITAPNILVISPNGGENWCKGEMKEIKWTASNVPNVKIEYTTNNGNEWNIIVGSIPTESGSYIWAVPSILSAFCKIRITALDYPTHKDESDSLFTISDLVSALDEIDTSVPIQYILLQNYPNPFNPTTTINYSLKERGQVLLSVYNMLGQKVIDLVNSVKEAGTHSVTFDGSSLPSGVYIYRIQSNGFNDSKKLLLLK